MRVPLLNSIFLCFSFRPHPLFPLQVAREATHSTKVRNDFIINNSGKFDELKEKLIKIVNVECDDKDYGRKPVRRKRRC